MKQTVYEKLISNISSHLRIMEEFGTPITTELIEKKIEEIAEEFKSVPNFDLTETNIKRLKFDIGNSFNVSVGEHAITLHSDLPRWFHAKKENIQWEHWRAYAEMLRSKGRAGDVLNANEKVIDDILDYSGDPSTPGTWSRKGLVMGNVQSGKTQNYLGLINKAIDCGYKTIILLGGHLNDLRRQTQERVDEGVLGRESKHLADIQSKAPAPIGVGLIRQNNVNTGTTTVGDFNKQFADRLGFKLTGNTVIFTIKKHTGVMERLYNWIKEFHFLNPDMGKKLDGPLLLIDDEADYASINTKHHREEVTRTNEYIRKILSLFSRNTYVAYTATPFANIFIDPDENSYSESDDLFPSDFMIKIPVPDNHLGQDFFFPQRTTPELEEGESFLGNVGPTIPIVDHAPIYELKNYESIREIPESLKEAVRSFIIVIAIRALRGEQYMHNTMLVNISHLTVHQNQIEKLISEYHQEVHDALTAFSGLGLKEARSSHILNKLEETFESIFSVKESFSDIFSLLTESSGKIKVWAINRNGNSSDERDLDYSKHKEHGLNVIVIGGHKLSRGLTLEGLSISYFARNSKAYDTLMQMCRWFGYRPNYEDLCKVFLPDESIHWYSFIAAAIRELYQELELMSKKEQRPKDFGLKVREHPGAMIITAKNKIGWSDTTVRRQDLWGQVQRRFRFRPELETNLRNLEYTKKFVARLLDDSNCESKLDEKSRSLIVENVEYNQLVEFIENIDLPEDDLGNEALIKHLREMERQGLKKTKVVVFNLGASSTSKPKWEKNKNLNEQDKAFLNKDYLLLPNYPVRLAKRKMIRDPDNGFFKVNSTHLGNPDDEKLFISYAARKNVEDTCTHKDPVSFDYICSEERESAGLMIFLFAVAIGPDKPVKNLSSDDKITLGHGHHPTVGYTVSFPRPENMKGKSREEIRKIVRDTRVEYRVGKVHSRLQELSAYEELYEDK